MTRIRAPWTVVLPLLISTTVRTLFTFIVSVDANAPQVFAEAGLNLNNNNIGPGVRARKVEDLTYGSVANPIKVKRGLDVPTINTEGKAAGLDASSLLNGAGAGQPGAQSG